MFREKIMPHTFLKSPVGFFCCLGFAVYHYGEKQFKFPLMMPTSVNLTDESISIKVHTSAMSSVGRKAPHLTC
jgi:hypothetical protein